jgi:hypothetical protein
VRSIGLNAQERLAQLFGGLSRAEQEDLVAGNVAKLYTL